MVESEQSIAENVQKPLQKLISPKKIQESAGEDGSNDKAGKTEELEHIAED